MLRNKGGSKLLQVPNRLAKVNFQFSPVWSVFKTCCPSSYRTCVTNTVAQVEYRCLCRYMASVSKLNSWLKKPFFRILGNCNVGKFEQAHCSSAEEAARCFGFVGRG